MINLIQYIQQHFFFFYSGLGLFYFDNFIVFSYFVFLPFGTYLDFINPLENV